MRLVTSFVLSTALMATPTLARAQRTNAPPEPRVYVVRPGDTLLRVATRLGVPPRDLAARNSIPRPYTLTVGRRLRVPPGVSPEVLATLPTREDASNSSSPQGAHRAGFVTMVRARDDAEIATNFAAAMPNLRLRIERFLRAHDGRMHFVPPRMLRALQLISDRFGGRRIVVLSGYRPPRPGAPVSHHHLGSAVDMRVEDVPLRDVWTFCQTLRNAGCGMYARANYVHVDMRDEPRAWQGPARRGARDETSALDADPTEDPAVVLADAEP